MKKDKLILLILVVVVASIGYLSYAYRRSIAFTLRKFWASCPKCKLKFGGHERYAKSLTLEGKRYRYVCPSCVPKD